MGTVFLHVGTMKSGTTYIQQSLDARAGLLAARGIRWFGTRHTNLAAQDLLQAKRRMAASEGAWKRFAEQIRSSDEDAVISMEMLGPAGAAARRRIKSSLHTHDLTLILTVRDLTKVVASRWQESTQNRREAGWTKFCEDNCAAELASDEPTRFWRHLDVTRVVDRYSAIVDRDRMRIITVPRTSSDPGLLWNRFQSALGVDATSKALPRAHNPSLGAVSSELLTRVNARTRDLDWPRYRHGVKTALAKRTLGRRASGEPRYGLSPEHHDWLRKRAVAVVEEIKASGIEIIGDLAELIPAEQAPAVTFSPDDLTDSLLLDAALDGLAGMGKIVGDLRLERDALREDVLRLSARPAASSAGRRLARGVAGGRWLRDRLRRH